MRRLYQQNYYLARPLSYELIYRFYASNNLPLPYILLLLSEEAYDRICTRCGCLKHNGVAYTFKLD